MKKLKNYIKSASDYKRIDSIESIDSIGTHAYGTNKDIVSEKEENKSSKIVKQYKNN